MLAVRKFAYTDAANELVTLLVSKMEDQKLPLHTVNKDRACALTIAIAAQNEQFVRQIVRSSECWLTARRLVAARALRIRAHCRPRLPARRGGQCAARGRHDDRDRGGRCVSAGYCAPACRPLLCAHLLGPCGACAAQRCST